MQSHAWSIFSPAHAQELGQKDRRRNEKRQGHRDMLFALCAAVWASQLKGLLKASTRGCGRSHATSWAITFWTIQARASDGFGGAACMLLFTDIAHA